MGSLGLRLAFFVLISACFVPGVSLSRPAERTLPHPNPHRLLGEIATLAPVSDFLGEYHGALDGVGIR